MSNITGKTKVIGIFGYPVEHSFSPAMHNAAFSELGLDYVYVPYSVKPADVAMAVQGIRAMGLVGVNVTIPHKNAVIEYLDELAPEAKIIGAVNTIVNENGLLKGYNTDAPGFVRSLETDGEVKPGGKRVLLMGAGGAARAVAVQLAISGAAEIWISSPVPAEVTAVRDTVTKHSAASVQEAAWDEESISSCAAKTDIIINATPLGMHPNEGVMPPVKLDSIKSDTLVCDLIYNPRETLLLKTARMHNLQTLNGLGMLLYQGAIAFELWTGVKPPLKVMKAVLENTV